MYCYHFYYFPIMWHYCWKPPLTKGWISTLVCSDHLSVSKMLISFKAAAFRLESLYILNAKICISHFSFIFNPRVSNLHHPNSINLVIMRYTDFKIANVIYTFHLSPTSCDQDLGLTKPDKVALFQLWADIYHVHPDMWHWEGQAEPAGRLRPYYHLCLQDIRDFATYPHGQEICRAAD